MDNFNLNFKRELFALDLKLFKTGSFVRVNIILGFLVTILHSLLIIFGKDINPDYWQNVLTLALYSLSTCFPSVILINPIFNIESGFFEKAQENGFSFSQILSYRLFSGLFLSFISYFISLIFLWIFGKFDMLLFVSASYIFGIGVLLPNGMLWGEYIKKNVRYTPKYHTKGIIVLIFSISLIIFLIHKFGHQSMVTLSVIATIGLLGLFCYPLFLRKIVEKTQ